MSIPVWLSLDTCRIVNCVFHAVIQCNSPWTLCLWCHGVYIRCFLSPCLYLSSSSQMPLRAYGSTPAVGSSRITTLDPPTNAMATDSFLCIPPAHGQQTVARSPQKECVIESRALERCWCKHTWEVLGEVFAFVRQTNVSNHLINLLLHIFRAPALQTGVEINVLLHGQTETNGNHEYMQINTNLHTPIRTYAIYNTHTYLYKNMTYMVINRYK